MPKLPEITITCHYVDANDVEDDQMRYSRFFVHWKDDKARYHIHLSGFPPVLDTVIHRNLHDKPGVTRSHFQTHRALDGNAEKHAPIMAAVRAKVTPDALKAVWETAKAECEAKKALERQAYADKMRKAIRHEADRMQLEGAGQTAHYLRVAVEALDVDQIIRLANTIRSA